MSTTHWVHSTLGAVAEIVTGRTPPTEHADLYGGETPFVKPGDLDKETHLSSATTYITASASDWTPFCPPGSVLVSCIGNLGKAAILARTAACNQQLNAILPTPALLSGFVYYWIRYIKPWMDANASATTVAILNKGRFAKAPIVVPPIAEQQRIVAAIEQHLSDIDAGVTSLQRSLTNLKRYRASVLKAACEGSLVSAAMDARSPPSSAGPADLVMDHPPLPAPKRAGRLWGSGSVPELTEAEHAALPPTWKWAKIRSLGRSEEEAVQVGPMSMRSQDFASTGRPVLNVGCVQWDRFKEEKLDHLPEALVSDFQRYLILPGDVLFTRSGTVGRCAVATERQRGWLMTFHLLRIRTDASRCVPSFLRLVLEGAPHIRRQTREASIGTTRAGFNTNLLADLDVPLPPLVEQHRIVAEVERLLSVADATEAAIRTQLARAARLRQSVLKRAFEGKLVPQDPNDEPASALLARIRGATAAPAPSAPKAPRTKPAPASPTPTGKRPRAKRT